MPLYLLTELLSSQRDYISKCWHAATSGVLFCFHKIYGKTNSAKCEIQWEQQKSCAGSDRGAACLSTLSAAEAVCGHSERRMNKASTCLKRNKILPFPASKYFQFGAFPESNLLLNPYKKPPFASTAFFGKSIACCAKNYFLFLVLIVSPISFIC